MFETFLFIFEAFENSNSTGRAVHLCGGRGGDMLSGHWFPPHVFALGWCGWCIVRSADIISTDRTGGRPDWLLLFGRESTILFSCVSWRRHRGRWKVQLSTSKACML